MTDRTTPPPAQPDTEIYEIRVRGHLDAHWAARLGVPSLTHETDGTTILGGIAADQAALHGLLQRIRDLGLKLVSVSRAEPTAAPSPIQPPSKRT
jgi:hypothetical protein